MMKEKELYILNLQSANAEFVITYCLSRFNKVDFDKKDVSVLVEKPSYNKFKIFINSFDKQIKVIVVERKDRRLFNRPVYRKNLKEVKNARDAIDYIRFLRAENRVVKTAKADIKELFADEHFNKIINVGNVSYYWVKFIENLKSENKQYIELRSFIVNNVNTDDYVKNKFWIDRYDKTIFLSESTKDRYNTLAWVSDFDKQELLDVDSIDFKLDLKINKFKDKNGQSVYYIEEIPNESLDRINLRVVTYVEKNTGLLLLSNHNENLDEILLLLKSKVKEFSKIIIFDFYYTISENDIKDFDNVELSHSSIELGSFYENFISLR